MNKPKIGFVSGTMVHTACGLKPIQDLNVGELILTYSLDGYTVFQPIVQIDKTVQAIYRCTLLNEEDPQSCTVDYLFTAPEQHIFTHNAWTCVLNPEQKQLRAFSLAKQPLSLWQGKPIFAVNTRTQQTIGLNAATFSRDLYPNGKDDEFICISNKGLVHYPNTDCQFKFSHVAAPLYRNSVNWHSLEQKTLVFPVYQLKLAHSDNYFVGEAGILARAS